MNRILKAGLLSAALVGMTLPAVAHRYDRQHDTHLLRPMAYVAHSVGILVEYTVMRPIHWAVSRDELDIVFGHQASVNDDGTYFEWVHGDYEPSIAVDRAALAKGGQKMVK